MSSRVTFTKTDNGTLIRIGNSLNGRVKILFLIQFIAYLGGFAMFFIWFLLLLDSTSIFLLLFTLGVSFVFLIAALRYLNRATEREEILVSPDQITISNITIRKKKTNSYNIADISDLHQDPPVTYTDHPLKGESFDYMGFAARDKELQTVNDEGRMHFTYRGKTIRFGKGIASWDARDISDAIFDITRIKMSYYY